MYQSPNDHTQAQPPFRPTPPPLPHQRWAAWWRRQSKTRQLILGIIILSIALCCTCSAIASVAGQHIQAVVTPTSAVAQVGTSVPTWVSTKVPTPKPTQKSTPTPTSKPTQAPTLTPTPAPTQAPATGVNGNPWGYDFTPGNLIYSPNPGFCDYFSCVSTFWTKTNGYVVECGNGEYSHSGGVSGACSRDGGVTATLYSH